ncbi:MAG: 50S ribosomal protein L31 [Candidatus Wallbacteria bacterium]|nr:50S ribosomal protein L31 [Candidatus Wallbacteria bacterium]
MKPEGHPELHTAKVVCACGEQWSTLSTVNEIRVEICSACHPFFTGKQRFVDTAGRVEKFQQKFANSRKRATK